MNTVIVQGIGELGGVFARAFLKSGFAVVPLRRGDSPEALASTTDPDLIVVAVGEAELSSVLESTPESWRDRLFLIQNELLPNKWALLSDAGHTPSVGVIWFEKKPAIVPHEIQPSILSGPHAELISDTLSTIGLASTVVDSESLVAALVVKNLYILTANLAGLKLQSEGIQATTGDLAQNHRHLAESFAKDALKIQFALLGNQVANESSLMDAMFEAFLADPEHKAMGRSATARLKRALDAASANAIDVPTIAELSATQSSST